MSLSSGVCDNAEKLNHMSKLLIEDLLSVLLIFSFSIQGQWKEKENNFETFSLVFGRLLPRATSGAF